jgi:uncharacterized membrane protein YeiH
MHIFDIFSIIGTIAFAMSGAFVAMEEEYDILGVLVLGLVTALGRSYRIGCIVGIGFFCATDVVDQALEANGDIL